MTGSARLAIALGLVVKGTTHYGQPQWTAPALYRGNVRKTTTLIRDGRWHVARDLGEWTCTLPGQSSFNAPSEKAALNALAWAALDPKPEDLKTYRATL